MAAIHDPVVSTMSIGVLPVLVLLYALAYFLGAVPFGYLVGKSQGIDITKVGSGNIGATNTYRALGRSAGLTVFALDVAKGVVPPVLVHFVLAGRMDPALILQHQVFVSVAAVLGHSFSPFLRFKGGKGVATGLGTILGIAPIVGVAGFVVFLLVLVTVRIVSVASILGSLTVVLTAVLTRQPPLVVGVYGFVVALVIVRHVPNIRRFFRGEEPRFEFKKKKPAEPVQRTEGEETGSDAESGP